MALNHWRCFVLSLLGEGIQVEALMDKIFKASSITYISRTFRTVRHVCRRWSWSWTWDVSTPRLAMMRLGCLPQMKTSFCWHNTFFGKRKKGFLLLLSFFVYLVIRINYSMMCSGQLINAHPTWVWKLWSTMALCFVIISSFGAFGADIMSWILEYLLLYQFMHLSFCKTTQSFHAATFKVIHH